VPELPDVEGYRRYWTRYAVGRRVAEVDVPNPAILRNRTVASVRRALRGRRFGDASRRGKWLLAPTDGVTLLLHFGMTGLLVWRGGDDPKRHRHDRLVFRFADGELSYRNMRMLGGAWVARDERELDRLVGDLGPDAADLDRERLEELLAGRRGGIKATLMNQRLVAGIGNELSDEILWRAKVHPGRGIATLERRELGALQREMQQVITASMRHGRIPRERSWLEGQRGRRDARCPRCHTELRRSRIAGRTSYWCPRCQGEGSA
jgi:formamidopyrimidine-DNA glycosylase